MFQKKLVVRGKQKRDKKSSICFRFLSFLFSVNGNSFPSFFYMFLAIILQFQCLACKILQAGLQEYALSCMISSRIALLFNLWFPTSSIVTFRSSVILSSFPMGLGLLCSDLQQVFSDIRQKGLKQCCLCDVNPHRGSFLFIDFRGDS